MIKPRLIHPIIILIAKMDVVNTKFDDKWHSKKESTVIKYNGLNDKGEIVDECQLITLRAQLNNSMMKSFQKQTGGWIRESKMSFFVKSEDLLNEDGSDRLNKGDKIVRMTDLAGLATANISLFVRDVLYRAPYKRFEFIELICEKETALVQ